MRRYTNNRKSYLHLVAVIVAAIALSFVINRSLKPVIMNMARQYGASAVLKTVNEAVSEVFSDVSVGYSDLVRLSYNESGFVTSCEYNSQSINQLKLRLSESLAQKLDKLKLSKISVPIGSVAGDLSLSGKGPKLKIRISQSSVPDIQLISSIESAGINTVKHELILRIKVDSQVYLPPSKDDFSCIQDFVIAQTIIVGSIPSGYADIG